MKVHSAQRPTEGPLASPLRQSMPHQPQSATAVQLRQLAFAAQGLVVPQSDIV